jgi:hypothetical protein
VTSEKRKLLSAKPEQQDSGSKKRLQKSAQKQQLSVESEQLRQQAAKQNAENCNHNNSGAVF